MLCIPFGLKCATWLKWSPSMVVVLVVTVDADHGKSWVFPFLLYCVVLHRLCDQFFSGYCYRLLWLCTLIDLLAPVLYSGFPLFKHSQYSRVQWMAFSISSQLLFIGNDRIWKEKAQFFSSFQLINIFPHSYFVLYSIPFYSLFSRFYSQHTHTQPKYHRILTLNRLLFILLMRFLNDVIFSK